LGEVSPKAGETFLGMGQEAFVHQLSSQGFQLAKVLKIGMGELAERQEGFSAAFVVLQASGRRKRSFPSHDFQTSSLKEEGRVETSHAEPGLHGQGVVQALFGHLGESRPEFGIHGEELSGSMEGLLGFPKGGREAQKDAVVCPGFGIAWGEFGGAPSGFEGFLEMTGFQEGLGKAEVELGTAGFEGQCLPVARNGPFGIVTAAAPLEGSTL